MTHLPAVRRGQPRAGRSHTYRAIRRDGITIWAAPRIQPETREGTIRIDLRRFLWLKQLVVKGAAAVPVAS